MSMMSPLALAQAHKYICQIPTFEPGLFLIDHHECGVSIYTLDALFHISTLLEYKITNKLKYSVFQINNT